MVAHRLVEIQAVEERRVVACEQFVGDDEDFRIRIRLLEHQARIGLAVRRKLVLRNERAVDNIGGILGIDRRSPFGGQQLVECPLVLGTGFAVHADEERLVMERCHVLAEMLGDERGNFFDAVVGGEEGSQADGSVEDLVERIHIGDALCLGEGEEFLVEPLGRHHHLARG